MTVTIAVVNRKGGVGKTTMAAHLAAGLAARGFRVGLIDTDSQGHCAVMLGAPEENGLFDALISGAAVTDVAREIPATRYTVPDAPANGALYLIPGAEKTHKIPHEMDESQGFSFVELGEAFAEAYKLDAIVVDTNPTLSRLDGAIWLAVDAYLYVVECERLAFDGLEKAIGQLVNFTRARKKYVNRETRVIGIQPNKMRGTQLHQHNIAELGTRYPGYVWEPIPLRIGWAQATNANQLVFTYIPASVEANCAWGVVDRTIGVLSQWSPVAVRP